MTFSYLLALLHLLFPLLFGSLFLRVLYALQLALVEPSQVLLASGGIEGECFWLLELAALECWRHVSELLGM